MSDFKSEQIKSVIKDLLKKKKLTYENVAQKLECSVPTVKRILGPEELSLPRLLQLCDLLDVNLTDLETILLISKSTEEKFKPEQEEFLAKNPHILAYFVSLFSMTPEEIAAEHKLSARSTDKYLIALEKMELIRVTGKLKVKPAFHKIPRFGSGPLGVAYYRKLIQQGADFFIQHISDRLAVRHLEKDDKTPQGFTMQSFKVSKNSYTQFMNEQEKARDAFFKLAAYEEKALPPEELKTTVHISAYTLVENEDKTLKIFENAFGEIKNF